MLVKKEVLKALASVTDTESSRYALNSIRLERENYQPVGKTECKPQPVGVACDGRRLLMVRWCDDDADEYPVHDRLHAGRSMKDGEGLLIPQAACREAIQLATKNKSASKFKPILQNVVVDERNANGSVCLGVSDGGDTVRTLETKTSEGKFPAWRDVVPEYKSDEAVEISFDASLMTGFLDAIRTVIQTDGQRPTVNLRVPKDGKRPILITGTDGDGTYATGMLMPVNEKKT